MGKSAFGRQVCYNPDMKLGILADIHGNLEALNSCLEASKGIENYICPGDIVGYGPDPNECVEMISKLKCLTVAGNHDATCTGKLDAANFYREAREAIEWTAKVLTGLNRQFLEGLPEYIAGNDFEMVHGSLRRPLEEYVSNLTEGAATIELMKKRICFVGHLHIPLVIVREMNGNHDGWQLGDGDVVDINKFDKVIINVGAVGQPRDMDQRASFGIYDTEAGTIEVRKVEYNILAVQKKMRKAKIPDFLVERLKFGR